MTSLLASAIGEASSTSRPWIVLGLSGLSVAVVLRLIVTRVAREPRFKKWLSAATLILASSAVAVIVIGLVIHLPPAENGDQFYPSLQKVPAISTPNDK